MSMSLWEEESPLHLDSDPSWDKQWAMGLVELVYVSTRGDIAIAKEDRTLLRGDSQGVIYEPESHLYLGTMGETPIFGVMGDHPYLVPLRQALTHLHDGEVALAMRAAALAQYHARNRYCSCCGEETITTDLGRTRTCQSCDEVHFPRTDPAIIVAVIDESDRLLLGHHIDWELGRFSLLAGFLEVGESLEQAVVRELNEEVGVVVSQITYAGSQPWPTPRSLMVAFTAQASGQEPIPDLQEITHAQWFTRQDLRTEIESGTVTLPMPHSVAHRLITRWYGEPLPQALM
ncbi:MAG: NAD(+) diphosphatase [Propionibacteriaceae bacterium]|jgi:NAD+ diphosphatase|nr:NAD(+) diphosphatase [Propionibacteriaceae bacterium]